MIRKTLLLSLAGVVALAAISPAQEAPVPQGEKENTPNDVPGPNRYWQANVGGGTYMVALDRIVSVSRHQYVLDGAVIVDEVTIDTVGQALARFYHFTPVTDTLPGNAAQAVTDRGREWSEKATSRAGTQVTDMVIKKYPDTTHAKSLEYRVKSEAELKSLYNSVQTAWQSGRGRQFTSK